ncbi:MAG: tetratricopeptide repeat protein, partial [Petrimonas sp.]|nr:tetratricopeptide repeat protein [Petrimonas sp.]
MKFYLTFFAFFCVVLISAQSQTYQQWILKSADYMEANRLDSAEFALQRAMKLEPANENNAALLMSLGVIQRQLGRYNDAYISFTAALSRFPDATLALHNRAALLCDMNKYEDAMLDYNEILRLDPANIQAYYRRGLLYLEAKDRKSAEEDLNKA